MKKNYETGHIQNLASMKLLIAYCNEMGEKYKPAGSRIALGKLGSLLRDAAAAQDEVNNMVNQENNAINTRYYTFLGLATFCSAVVASYVTSETTKENIKDAKYLLRKIQGRRAKPIEKPAAPKEGEAAEPINHISASQQGMDEQIEYFSRLIKLLAADSHYNPNEEELKLTNLSVKLDAMIKTNEDVMAAKATVNLTRSKRDLIMYAFDSGMVDVALQAKEYVKSVYQGRGDEFKKIRAIPFRNYRQRRTQSR